MMSVSCKMNRSAHYFVLVMSCADMDVKVDYAIDNERDPPAEGINHY